VSGNTLPNSLQRDLMILEAFTALLYIFYDPASKQYALTPKVISLASPCFRAWTCEISPFPTSGSSRA